MSMIKVDVANNNGKTYSAKFETELLADAWILEQVKNESWGSNKEVEQANSYFSKCIFAVDEYEEDCTTKHYGPDNYSIVKTDITEQDQKNKLRQDRIVRGKIAKEKCDNALALVAGFNLDAEKTEEEIDAMEAEFSLVLDALNKRRPEKAKRLIMLVEKEELAELKSEILEVLK